MPLTYGTTQGTNVCLYTHALRDMNKETDSPIPFDINE